MLNDLIDSKIDIGIFDGNYKNDKTGARAIPPPALIKLVIYGYSKGKKSSRGLGKLAEENIIAKALTGNLEPHWTSIADFISSNSEKFQAVFSHALAYCVELGLVGGDTFAIDGLRLPSNASIQMSGTKEELEKKLAMYQRMAEKHVAKHRKQDAGMGNAKETERNYQKRQKHLNRQIEKISSFLRCAEQKKGKNDKEVKSNVTDNKSVLLHSSAGYLQGYRNSSIG
jgi:transposase